jgi:hypothetical protein
MIVLTYVDAAVYVVLVIATGALMLRLLKEMFRRLPPEVA